jgi:hypothetical protein
MNKKKGSDDVYIRAYVCMYVCVRCMYIYIHTHTHLGYNRYIKRLMWKFEVHTKL